MKTLMWYFKILQMILSLSEIFEVLEFDSIIVANNLTFHSMRNVFRDYMQSLQSFDVGFIYYSGHGMQDAYNETYFDSNRFSFKSNH